MHTWDVVRREHVLATIAEYDATGGEQFLADHGFGSTTDYVLWHDGRSYDSKAILGVALGAATGEDANAGEFSGGKKGAAKVLTKLGFTVAYVGDEARSDEEGHHRSWVDVSDVGAEAAREAWAAEARALLIETARKYQAVRTHRELAQQVQERTGIRSKRLNSRTIPDVLQLVGAECEAKGEPLLPALCVNTQGSVGDGYAAMVGAVRGDVPADGDAHAATERLACNTFFGADLPEGGGLAQLTPQLTAARTRQRKASAAERAVNVCPTCFMAIPATGVCDNCD